jgi:transcriptional regulator with XRE-family HTH domain
MKSLNQKMREMGAARRKKVERRAAELIAEEMSLRELRRAHKLTQERIAETLGIGQDQVSRLEQRSDLLLSTLRGYVEAMGGQLKVIAEFPHRNPVLLSGFASLGAEETVVAARKEHANVKIPTQAKTS